MWAGPLTLELSGPPKAVRLEREVRRLVNEGTTMERTQHPTNNDVLGAPPGATIEECMALPITRVQFVSGENACVSFWRPTAAELLLLATGKPVRLCVMGGTHPPLSLGVDGDEVML